MNKVRALALVIGFAFTAPAFAAEGSIGLTAGSGTNAALTAADGAGNVSFLHGFCGGASATMGTACANQAIINSSGQLLTLDSQSGTWNITNISGTISLPTGAATAANQGIVTTWAGGTLGAMANYGTSPGAVLAPGVNSYVTNTNANVTPADGITTTLYGTAAASPVIGSPILWNGTTYDRAREGTATGVAAVSLPTAQVTADPCSLSAKTTLPISTNATALTQIIAVSGSNKIYICSIALIAPGATAFNLIRGTGTNCATGSPTAIFGSTTAANGMSFAANGGFTLGNGSGTVGVTNASDELCTLQSNAVQVAGNLTYVQAP